ncbi:uncharacterized protein At4g26485 isoform X2 [Jatropha curcas]|uniref:uncharacterized protein At4g26485 isoform X1 n=1 Tax=Jatropha curcas TaxID=180498 RepID=UPI0018940050|nr:uncharacterized protein At4g26485 isoform X1 [Jatropha curcas]XP_037493318.1 uncharacterized protein At4g26485 isoform X2 [Jatropha curcas]
MVKAKESYKKILLEEEVTYNDDAMKTQIMTKIKKKNNQRNGEDTTRQGTGCCWSEKETSPSLSPSLFRWLGLLVQLAIWLPLLLILKVTPLYLHVKAKESYKKIFLEEEVTYNDDDDEDTDYDEDKEEEQPEKWRGHYSSRHTMLLVGEGDFSFSLSLARAFGSAHNMVATTIDTEENIKKKYRNGVANVRELEERGCLVLYGVDAKEMSQHFFLRTQRFDRIVYNFPHVGFLYHEGSYRQIQLNKGLIKGFLSNSRALLKGDNGEIHVTHKEGDPYDKWDLVKTAEKLGLVMYKTVPFNKNDYPGYKNKRAHGKLSDAPFPLGHCSTYKFKLKCLPKFPQHSKSEVPELK